MMREHLRRAGGGRAAAFLVLLHFTATSTATAYNDAVDDDAHGHDHDHNLDDGYDYDSTLASRMVAMLTRPPPGNVSKASKSTMSWNIIIRHRGARFV